MPPVAKKDQAQDEKRVDRVVAHLSIRWQEGGIQGPIFTARRDEEVSLPVSEAERLEALGAVLPEGGTPEDSAEQRAAALDAYRATRGDQDAMQRHMRRIAAGNAAAPVEDVTGGIVNFEGEDALKDGPGPLSEWIKTNEPSADETIALAGGDAARADVVLEAESLATGGDPRPEVVEGLEKLRANG